MPSVALDGFPFRIVDTAGLRGDADEVEALGIEVAERWIERASVVIWCRAGSEGPPTRDEVAEMKARMARDDRPRVLVRVRTMADLDPGETRDAPGWIRASVVDGTGLGEVRGALVAAAFGGLTRAEGSDPGSVLVRERHREALARAGQEIEAAVAALRDEVPAEFAATHLAAAEEALLELIGPVGGDDVLDVLFRSFCIGK
jgi:tRNA modification GTPase